MVLASEEIKKYIVLWANAEDFSHFVHIVENVDSEN